MKRKWALLSGMFLILSSIAILGGRCGGGGWDIEVDDDGIDFDDKAILDTGVSQAPIALWNTAVA